MGEDGFGEDVLDEGEADAEVDVFDVEGMCTAEADVHHPVFLLVLSFYGQQLKLLGITYPTLSKYSQNSNFDGSLHSLLRYALRNIFLCRICGLFSSGWSSSGPSKLVLLVVKALAVMSYCRSFLYTMLTTAGMRALMYFEPVIRASMSSIERARCVSEMRPGIDRGSAGGDWGKEGVLLTAIEV